MGNSLVFPPKETLQNNLGKPIRGDPRSPSVTRTPLQCASTDEFTQNEKNSCNVQKERDAKPAVFDPRSPGICRTPIYSEKDAVVYDPRSPLENRTPVANTASIDRFYPLCSTPIKSDSSPQTVFVNSESTYESETCMTSDSCSSTPST